MGPNNMFDDILDGLVDGILDDYTKGRVIDVTENVYDMPDRDIIIEIIQRLRMIVFPGHFKNKLTKVFTMKNNITMLLEDVMYKLANQIAKVLRYIPEYENSSEAERFEEGKRISLDFAGKLTKIREYIATDVEAMYVGDPAAFNHDEIIFSYPGLFAIMTYRIAHELYLLSVPLIPRIMTEYAHNLTGIDINPGATIGKYFFIDHGTGIVIGETTEIGENVKIYQGVTLGALSTRGGQNLRNKKRHPTIGDNVTIYSGASILGGETVIGRDVVIGGNAFITSSVPDGAKVSIKTQELTFNYKNGQKPEPEDHDKPLSYIERTQI